MHCVASSAMPPKAPIAVDSDGIPFAVVADDVNLPVDGGGPHPAVPVCEADDKECRIASADHAYTKHEFVAYYGEHDGALRWDNTFPMLPSAAAAPPAVPMSPVPSPSLHSAVAAPPHSAAVTSEAAASEPGDIDTRADSGGPHSAVSVGRGQRPLRNRPLSECDPKILAQQKAEKENNRCIAESELMETETETSFELTVITLAGIPVATLDRRDVWLISHVKAAVAQACETQVAGIRVLLDGVELNDSARISLQMKCLQVIFHEDYLIIMRMKGNMKHKKRIFGLVDGPIEASDVRRRLYQTIQEQSDVWTAIGHRGQLGQVVTTEQIREDQIRPSWAGRAFVLVTKEHAKYVARAIALTNRRMTSIDKDICTTTTVILSPPFKDDLENLADEYIKTTQDGYDGSELKDLKSCFPRDTNLRIALDVEEIQSRSDDHILL